MKNITIAGRTGKDAVLRRLQDGTPVLGFSVATDDGYGQNKRTLWFDCSLFGKRGESLAQYLTKGTAVAVSGDLSTREHEGRTYLTVRVSEVTMQGGGERQEQPRQQRQQNYGEASGGNPSSYDDRGGAPANFDDDIPFLMEWR